VAVIAVHLVAYLTELGHTPGFAAIVAGLLGILSVTGRLVTTATTRRLSAGTVTAIVFTVQGAAAACLPLIGRGQLGAIGCVLGFGLGFGVATIARPAILADRYGTTAYATISGFLAVPLTIAKALAPLAAAAIRYATGSYRDVALSVAALCLLAAVALLSVRRLAQRRLLIRAQWRSRPHAATPQDPRPQARGVNPADTRPGATTRAGSTGRSARPGSALLETLKDQGPVVTGAIARFPSRTRRRGHGCTASSSAWFWPAWRGW
jgi:hypothetical protein